MYTDFTDKERGIRMFRKGIILIFLLSMGLFMVLPAAAKEGTIYLNTEAENASVHKLGTQEATGFRLTDSYGGGYLTYDDTLSPELALWFSGKAGEGIIGSRADRELIFGGLTEGLYLVKSEANEFAPFLVAIPWDGYHWELELNPTDAAVPQTGDGIGFALFSMAASGAGITLLGRRKKC